MFGIVAITRTGGLGLFAQEHLPWVLGLRANPAFGVASVVVGPALLLAALAGGNTQHYVTTGGGVLFLLVGLAMMGLLRTSGNFLGFTMTNCVVSLIFGMVLLAAGLYSRVDTRVDKRVSAGGSAASASASGATARSTRG